jgi:hypothetical protein
LGVNAKTLPTSARRLWGGAVLIARDTLSDMAFVLVMPFLTRLYPAAEIVRAPRAGRPSPAVCC